MHTVFLVLEILLSTVAVAITIAVGAVPASVYYRALFRYELVARSYDCLYDALAPRIAVDERVADDATLQELARSVDSLHEYLTNGRAHQANATAEQVAVALAYPTDDPMMTTLRLQNRRLTLEQRARARVEARLARESQPRRVKLAVGYLRVREPATLFLHGARDFGLPATTNLMRRGGKPFTTGGLFGAVVTIAAWLLAETTTHADFAVWASTGTLVGGLFGYLASCLAVARETAVSVGPIDDVHLGDRLWRTWRQRLALCAVFGLIAVGVLEPHFYFEQHALTAAGHAVQHATAHLHVSHATQALLFAGAVVVGGLFAVFRCLTRVLSSTRGAGERLSAAAWMLGIAMFSGVAVQSLLWSGHPNGNNAVPMWETDILLVAIFAIGALAVASRATYALSRRRALARMGSRPVVRWKTWAAMAGTWIGGFAVCDFVVDRLDPGTATSAGVVGIGAVRSTATGAPAAGPGAGLAQGGGLSAAQTASGSAVLIAVAIVLAWMAGSTVLTTYLLLRRRRDIARENTHAFRQAAANDDAIDAPPPSPDSGSSAAPSDPDRQPTSV